MKAFTPMTSAAVPPYKYPTSTASAISASVAPAARASLASFATPLGSGAIVRDHAHEEHVLGRNGAVFQDAISRCHVGLYEMRIVRLDWFKSRLRSWSGFHPIRLQQQNDDSPGDQEHRLHTV